MKSLIVILVVIGGLFNAQVDKNILPKKAQSFIETHFPDINILKIKEEKDGSYEVQLATGHELEFDKNGVWIEVDGDYIPLPKSVIDLLPVKAQQYIAKKYSRRAIVKIEKEVYGYEVELSNSVELLFDHEGKFLKKD